MQKGGSCTGLQLVLIWAFLLLLSASCVKRAPRSNDNHHSSKNNPSENRQRCGLICTIKKKSREKDKDENKEKGSLGSGHSRPWRDKDKKDDKPAPPKPRGKGVYHTVKKGETLWRICHTYGADVKEVSNINRISDPTTLKVGQKIWIPGASGVKAVPRKSPGRSGSPSSPKSPSPKHGDLLNPVPGGRISSGFGMRNGNMHEGVDIVAPQGSKVLAADDGKVVYSDDTIRGYGNMIILKHAGNVSTVYAHNKRNLVRSGEIVKRGQQIAEVGMTGRATGPHLHFEVRVGEKPVNPKYYLP